MGVMYVCHWAHVAWNRRDLRRPTEMLSKGQALRRDRILRQDVRPDPRTRR